MNAARLVLDVRLEAFEDPIGTLAGFDDGTLRFGYQAGYLDNPAALPISLALDLRADPFSDAESRAFFQNLLPENDQFEQVIQRERLERNDVAGLLYFLGSDCPGAISCRPQGAPPAKRPGLLAEDYDAVSDELLKEIVRRLAFHERLPAEIRDPSPVAGVQRKIALTRLADGRFAQPKPGLGVPTTHILKVPYVRDGRDTSLEEWSARLADACGLDVSVPQAIKVDEIDVLVVERFDRRVDGQGRVTRLHQEDFAQALGLPSRAKYERYGVGARSFSAAAISRLLDRTVAPDQAREQFLLSTFFSILIGNVDNHAKNHGLLYDVGPRPRFAPLYDLTPTKLDRQTTREFSFNIGEAKSLGELDLGQVLQFFDAFGLEVETAGRFVAESLAPMIERLEAAAPRVPRRFKDFDDLIGRETETLVEILGLNVEVRPRDAFND
jgi:serine/threonine-protein kinase HipA